ncbi:hypothetical protein K435DRAFT_575601, partial [Dendrothele bispora CBS 962.96]
ENTPTKLPRYLSYAKEKLGVNNAPSYEAALREKSYGPDILQHVDDKELISLNIPPGDVIRLKKGCEAWMRSPLSQSATSDGSGRPADSTDNSIRFEKVFLNPEGYASFFGDGIERAPDSAVPTDSEEFQECDRFHWYFHSTQLKQRVRLPPGFIPRLFRE